MSLMNYFQKLEFDFIELYENLNKNCVASSTTCYKTSLFKSVEFNRQLVCF